MKPIRAVAVLPTLFTLGNLVCGFFAIVVLARIEKPEGVQPPSPRIELKVDSPKELGEKAREFIESEDPTHNLMLCGVLILLATHDLDVVNGLLTRELFLRNGRLMEVAAGEGSLRDRYRAAIAPG